MEINIQAGSQQAVSQEALSGSSAIDQGGENTPFQTELPLASAQLQMDKFSELDAKTGLPDNVESNLFDGNLLPLDLPQGNALPSVMTPLSASINMAGVASSVASAGSFEGMAATLKQPTAQQKFAGLTSVSTLPSQSTNPAATRSLDMPNSLLSDSGVAKSVANTAAQPQFAPAMAAVTNAPEATLSKVVSADVDADVAVASMATPIGGAVASATSLNQAIGQPSVPSPIQIPVGQPGWDSAVGERLTMAIQNNQQSVEIKLTPANLGPMEVQITRDSDGINITLISQHGAVRDALEAAVPKLREMFDQAQLDLVNVDVSEQSERSFGDQASSSDDSEELGGDDPEASATTTHTVVGTGKVGLLDTFV